MAKLLIFRGDTQVDERELTGKTVRIGRAPQNDLVLEDQGKGVSRNHAEIRCEGGRYTLIDLGSQNGIWVLGTRVPSAVLEPGVSAALGPYRLMVEAPVALTPAIAVAPIGAVDTATELTQLSERSAAPLALDTLGPPPKKQESAPPAVERRPTPVAKEPTRKERVKEPTVSKAVPLSLNVRILWAVVALLLIAASAAIAYRILRKPVPPHWDSSVAQALIASGKCQEALNTQINPALQRNPIEPEALRLRDDCNRTLAQATSITTSSIPASPTADERLNQAEPMLQANLAADCQKALDIINAVLVEDANNQRAKDLATRANTCITPTKGPGTPPIASTEKPAVPVPPSQGGLDIIPGETDKAYKTRMAVARKKYDDAVAVLATQKYAQALSQFNELMNEVPSGYLELQQRREEAMAGIRGEAKTAFDAAQTAESRHNYDVAVEQYRRAHQLDPNLAVDAQIQRITQIVRSKCDVAIVDLAFDANNSTAIEALRDAVRVLPPSEPCQVKARERLQQLKK